MIIQRIRERRIKARKKKKKIFKVFISIGYFIVIIAVLFFFFLLIKHFSGKFITTKNVKVIEAHVTSLPLKLSCRGLLLKEEKCYLANIPGTFHQIVSEGERVKKGDRIAKIYNYKVENDLKNKNNDINKQILSLSLSLNYYLARWEIADRTLTEILIKKADSYKEDLLTFKMDNAKKIDEEIQQIVNKRQDLNKNKRKYQSETMAKIEILDKENKGIDNNLDKNVSGNFLAEKDGIVSYSFDDYEGKLSPGVFLKNPFGDFSKIEDKSLIVRNGQQIDGEIKIFKLIEEPLYIVAKVPIDKKDCFLQGEERVILFPVINSQACGTIEKVCDNTGDDILILISLKQFEKTIVPKRNLDMDIILSKTSGIILPSTAKIEKYGETGVYIVEKNIAKFKSVRITQEDSRQIVVDGLKDNTLIITDGRNIREGTNVVIKSKVKSNEYN